MFTFMTGDPGKKVGLLKISLFHKRYLGSVVVKCKKNLHFEV